MKTVTQPISNPETQSGKRGPAPSFLFLLFCFTCVDGGAKSPTALLHIFTVFEVFKVLHMSIFTCRKIGRGREIQMEPAEPTPR